jgi:alpha-beta hydrolase superfamily lysophospholipase
LASHDIKKIPAKDDRNLAVREWIQDTDAVTVIYVHGIQSHSGWMVDTGQWLYDKGFNVFAYDRCGSGCSDGTRGHMGSFREAIEDLDFVILYAKEHAQGRDVFLMALCWGAKLAAAYEIEKPGSLDGLILLTPGIKAKLTLPLIKKAGIFLDLFKGGRSYFELPLTDSMFTDEERYLDFISHDDLSLRKATSRFLYESLKMDRVTSGRIDEIKIPVLCFLAGRDPIVDNPFVSSLMNKINAEVTTYHDVLHSIEFNTEARDVMLEKVKNWIHKIVDTDH